MENQDTIQPEQPTNEIEELSHTDKIVGVISEPSSLFSKLVHLNTKVTDWLLPTYCFDYCSYCCNISFTCLTLK